jgi:hypothetical protein
MADHPTKHHRIAAAFVDPAAAKAAMMRLEQAGVGANAIDLVSGHSQPRGPGVAEADSRKVRWLAGRLGKGAVVGAIVGAVILVAIVLIIGPDPLAPFLVGAGIVGAAGGALLGSFLWVGANLPRNPDAWDTYLLDHRDEACISVTVDQEQSGEVRELLEGAGATSIDSLVVPTARPRRW